jgi:16S rRNA (cytosine967-C5)-methyltransferase
MGGLRGYPIPDWRQLEGTPERKIKGRFDELSKVRALKESIQIGWTNWELKN